MKVCSVCDNNLDELSGEIVKGASEEWVCKRCLARAGISQVQFSSQKISSNQIMRMILNRKQAVSTQPTNSPNQKKKSGMSKGSKIALIVISIICGFAIIGALFGEEEAEAPTSNNSSITSSVTEPEIEYIEITAQDLWNAYSDNEVAAEQKYSDKNVKITGVIESINSGDTFTSTNILLEVDDLVGNIQCNFDNSEDAKAVANVKKGQSVTIIGTCDNLEIWNIHINGCELQ